MIRLVGDVELIGDVELWRKSKRAITLVNHTRHIAFLPRPLDNSTPVQHLMYQSRSNPPRVPINSTNAACPFNPACRSKSTMLAIPTTNSTPHSANPSNPTNTTPRLSNSALQSIHAHPPKFINAGQTKLADPTGKSHSPIQRLLQPSNQFPQSTITLTNLARQTPSLPAILSISQRTPANSTTPARNPVKPARPSIHTGQSHWPTQLVKRSNYL